MNLEINMFSLQEQDVSRILLRSEDLKLWRNSRSEVDARGRHGRPGGVPQKRRSSGKAAVLWD